MSAVLKYGAGSNGPWIEVTYSTDGWPYIGSISSRACQSAYVWIATGPKTTAGT